MSRKIVHVVGTGTIGEPLIGLLCDFKDELGIDEVTFHKNTPLTTDRSKVHALLKRGARLAAHGDRMDGFRALDIKPDFHTGEAIDRASVVIDCTPSGVGHKNKAEYYEKYLHNTAGFIAQGSEFGFGKMYARGINDHVLDINEDRYIQVVSCNTHNLSAIIKTIALDEGENLNAGRFVVIRRANDVSQGSGFVPSPQVSGHKDEKYGTHHARDAALLFKTTGRDLELFSSVIKVNTQYMHLLHFHLSLNEPTTLPKVVAQLSANDRIATTDKVDACTVFSFGRDHGHFGRILNQTVVSVPTLHVSPDGLEVSGFCFTPQDGNSLLSSIAATEWFLYPKSYESKIQYLKPFLFDEV